MCAYIAYSHRVEDLLPLYHLLLQLLPTPSSHITIYIYIYINSNRAYGPLILRLQPAYVSSRERFLDLSSSHFSPPQTSKLLGTGILCIHIILTNTHMRTCKLKIYTHVEAYMLLLLLLALYLCINKYIYVDDVFIYM